jgi:hypothetical protein
VGKERRLAFHHSSYAGPTSRLRQTILPLAVFWDPHGYTGEIAAQLKRYQLSQEGDNLKAKRCRHVSNLLPSATFAEMVNDETRQ